MNMYSMKVDNLLKNMYNVQYIKYQRRYKNIMGKIDDYKEEYSQKLNKFDIDKSVKPEYEFKGLNTLAYVAGSIIRKNDEPEWEINDELYKAVYEGMPDGLSLEEKAIYIYCKLCQKLSYDEGYFYRDKLNDGRYVHTFSREHLESIIPGAKITCWDFSRIFSKFVNGIEGDIEAIIISVEENESHYRPAFYTENVSVILEAIQGTTGGTNDLMKAKNGIKFGGIKTIFDRDNVINKAIDKVYPLAFGKKQLTINDYLGQLKQLPVNSIPNNFEAKLQSFIEIMKANNISGNEAIQTLPVFYQAGFFGTYLDRAYLGRKENQEGREVYRRMVLMRARGNLKDKDNAGTMYLLDSDSLELSTCTAKEIIEKLNSGELIYESEKHKMRGIDKEEE